MILVLLGLNTVALIAFGIYLHVSIRRFNATLRDSISGIWNELLADTIDKLTSEDVLVESLVALDEAQMQQLGDKVYDRKKGR